MKKGLLIIFLIMIVKSSFGQQFTDLYGDYLGMTPPIDTPVVFARGIISTDDLEHGAPSFSLDGNEVFWWVNGRPKSDSDKWTSWGMTMQRIGDKWTTPKLSSFQQPFFSPDSKRLYFNIKEQKDIYFSDKYGNNLSEPKSLGLVAHFPEIQFVYMASIANNGTLYFMGNAAGLGLWKDFGIYRAELFKGEYSKPELLLPNINAPGFRNWTPFIAPDESYLIFSSSRGSSEIDDGDLYICFRKYDGSWTDAVSLSEPINSNQNERFPTVSPDGKYLFFTRWTPDYDFDVYWVSTKVIDDIKKNPNVVNSIPNQLIFIKDAFELKIPKNTFFDHQDTTLKYSAKLQNGEALPDWLTFIPKTHEFSGTPTKEQILNITIKATDSDNNTASDNFQLTVIKHQVIDTNSVDLKTDLVLDLGFDGNLKDKSGNKYYGEIKGATPCEDRNGKENSAYFFDGEDDLIEVKNIKELDIIGALTISCRIKPIPNTARYSAWISRQNTGGNTSQFRFGFGWEPQSSWGFTLYNAGWQNYAFDNTIPLNEWTHVSFTFNKTDNTLNFYLNGELMYSASPKDHISFSDASLFIGYQADDNCYFHGCIDDVKIYNRALNSKEVKALYQLKE